MGALTRIKQELIDVMISGAPDSEIVARIDDDKLSHLELASLANGPAMESPEASQV